MLRLADRGVETSLAAGGCDRVPQRDPRLAERSEALFVRERDEVATDRVADQVPEAVLRMGVVAPLGERDFARQAAEDEDARVGRGQRRERELAGQNVVPLP